MSEWAYRWTAAHETGGVLSWRWWETPVAILASLCVDIGFRREVRRRSRRVSVLPERFEELARYNSERQQGLVHTEEHQRRMAVLQVDFYEWQAGAER